MSTTLDLPMPPSTNRLWRSRIGHGGKPQFYIAPRYATWKRTCDNLALANRKEWVPVLGPYRITVTFDRSRTRADQDNLVKAINDWLQKAGLIENDQLAVKTIIQWGKAPSGCRVVLSAVEREAA
jgi:Holliday junction resolvase RusA-like endonuclease